MRYSHQREEIRRILSSTDIHPTADWVYEQAKINIPNISLGTVYRNLKQLSDEGSIRIIFDGNTARYDCNQERHDHLRCKICGDLIDVQLFDNDIQKFVKEKYDFEADNVEMTIIGKCKKHTK